MPEDVPRSAMRRVLMGAAVAGAALAVLAERTRSVRILGDAPESMEVSRARALLRSLSLHEMEAAALGRRVIEGAVVAGAGATPIPPATLQVPQDPHAALGKLANDIAAAAGLSAEDIDADDRLRLARRLRLAIRTDFRRGNTVRVDGWLLAATESRLFVMAALLSRPLAR